MDLSREKLSLLNCVIYSCASPEMCWQRLWRSFLRLTEWFSGCFFFAADLLALLMAGGRCTELFPIDFLKDKPTKTGQTQRAAATVHRARFQQFIVADGCLLSGNIYTRPSCVPACVALRRGRLARAGGRTGGRAGGRVAAARRLSSSIVLSFSSPLNDVVVAAALFSLLISISAAGQRVLLL